MVGFGFYHRLSLSVSSLKQVLTKQAFNIYLMKIEKNNPEKLFLNPIRCHKFLLDMFRPNKDNDNKNKNENENKKQQKLNNNKRVEWQSQSPNGFSTCYLYLFFVFFFVFFFFIVLFFFLVSFLFNFSSLFKNKILWHFVCHKHI